MTQELKTVTAAVLAGGLGTRLRSVVADRPKVSAKVRGQAFLTYPLRKLEAAGIRKTVLCTGYLGDHLKRDFGDKCGALRLVYSQESVPLGTAGALRLALPLLESETVLVMNGDSYFDADLDSFWRWHRAKGARASLMLTQISNAQRFGQVQVDCDGRVLRFDEKSLAAGPAWINAGIYFIDRELLSSIPERKAASLEHEIFPNWIGHGLYGYECQGRFLDIGTPESLVLADDFFADYGSMKRRFVVLDRDGTIIVHRPYLSDPRQVELIPGAAAALRNLRKLGFGLAVVTNQSGIGRKYFDEIKLAAIHRRLTELLESEGVVLDGIYSCPHAPEDNCTCRKPRSGLVERAGKELDFDPRQAFVIGDNTSDIELGREIGASTILVRTGCGARVASEGLVTPDYTVNGVYEAARIIELLHLKSSAKQHDVLSL